MVILLCGEGSTDYGQRESGSQTWEEGPVQAYIRMIAADCSLSFIHLEKPDVDRQKIQRRGEGLLGHSLKPLKMEQLAKTKEYAYDIVACYVDSDYKNTGGRKTTNIKKKYVEVLNEINAGLSRVHCNGVAIVPATMIESWLLGDTSAIDSSITQPTDVEYSWGDKRDPKTDHPKCLLERIKHGANCTLSHAEIASAQNVMTIRSNCPLSFRPFFDRIVELAHLQDS